MSAEVLHGDCRELMRAMPDDSIDALVTDPPYGLGRTPPIVEILTRWLAGEDVEARGGGFMGRSWDSFVPGPATWREAFRVMKPGAHGVVFAGDRTVDLMAIALRLAGFEIRHQGAWVSAQVFPKSLDVSKAIDALDAEELLRFERHVRLVSAGIAAEWSGYGTAIKTIEPWILVRKPLSESSIARNVLRWGTGAINVDGCRLPWASTLDMDEGRPASFAKAHSGFGGEAFKIADRSHRDPVAEQHASGRWPSALIAADLDAEGPVVGVRVMGEGRAPGNIAESVMSDARGPVYGGGWRPKSVGADPDPHGQCLSGILGPYTRHFRIPGTDGDHDEAIPPELETLIICPKASTSEREEGLDNFEPQGGWTDGRATEIDNPRLRMRKQRRNVHATVKPVALMRHLVRLVTPPDGRVLDPFTGGGSTGVAAVWEGFDFVGCEMTETEPYVSIARARVAYAMRTKPPELRCRQPQPEVDPRQVSLFGEVGT